MSDTIKILFDIDPSDKYKHYTDNKDFYGTPEFYKAYQNWRKSKKGDSAADELLKGVFNDMSQTAINQLDKAIKEQIDNSVMKGLDNAMKQLGSSISVK